MAFDILESNYVEGFFWEIIEKIGWGTKTTDKEFIWFELNEEYAVKTLLKLRNFVAEKREILKMFLLDYSMKKQGNFDLYRGGDDSFWDLTAHIVGLGKNEYYAVMNNPELAVKRSISHDYEENFQYIFHGLKQEKSIYNLLIQYGE